MARTKNKITNRWRKESDEKFGKIVGKYLNGILPACVSETAAMTCRFQIMGKNAHADNGDAQRCGQWRNHLRNRWVHTRIQTFGHLPSERFQFVTKDKSWVKADSFEAADAILQCFGLNMELVLQHYGDPAEDERKILDLSQIVMEMMEKYGVSVE